MTRIQANGIEIEYQWHGDPTNPVIVGVVGLSDQLISWPSSLVYELVGAGYSFLAFDSRDTGLSTHFDEAPVGDIGKVLGGEEPFEHPYGLADMARDTTTLMDGLGIERAHIMGYSMGGAVAQLALAQRPELFISFVSIFSTSYAPGLSGRDDDVNQRMMACGATDISPAEWVRRMDHLLERIDGRHFQFDATLDATPEKLAARCFDSAGMARHVLAIYQHRMNPPLDQLAAIKAPTLIINSDDDCLFALDHGEDLQQRIPGSVLVAVEGSGHAFCTAVGPTLAHSIIPHLNAAQQQE
jgi:pimeloyl-ACP methyl ester carboxylesterase